MSNKSYGKFKKFIIDNHNFILFLILFTLVLNIKVPYIVERPGGIIPLNKQIKINGKYIEGDYNTSYVSVNKGTVISFIMGKIIPNWEVVPLKTYTAADDKSYDDEFKLERLEMKLSHNAAIVLVFDKLGIDYKNNGEKLFVYSKMPEMENDLKYNDQIIKCDDKKINYFDDLSSCISESNDDNVNLTVIRKNKMVDINVNLYEYMGRKIIGIGIYKDFDIESDYNIEFKNSSSESGSSGGLMTALALYDNLSKDDLIGNKKIAGTGTIDENGCVGEIGGIKYKLLGAEKKNVDIFFVPSANYKEALNVKKKYDLKIKLVKVSTIDDAIIYLMSNKN